MQHTDDDNDNGPDEDTRIIAAFIIICLFMAVFSIGVFAYRLMFPGG